jgi:hypothetical protein
VLALAGCGRLGFDPVVPDDGPNVTCTAAFCDGFEDVALAAWGHAESGGATTARDGSFGFVGASLHAVGPTDGDSAVRFADVYPAATTDQWARVYIFAPSSTTLDVEPLEMADAERTNELVFSLYDDAIDIHAHGMAGDFNRTLMEPPPRDTWSCYELHIVIAANGRVELFRDGALVISEPADTRPPQGTLERLHVGIASKPNGLSEALFLDEVAADIQRPGCL